MTEGTEKEAIHTENLPILDNMGWLPLPSLLDPCPQKSVPFSCPQQRCEVVQSNLTVSSQLLKKLTLTRTRTAVEFAEALVHGIFKTEQDRQEEIDFGELVFHWQRGGLVTYCLISHLNGCLYKYLEFHMSSGPTWTSFVSSSRRSLSSESA